jgi:hypothetical protein
MSNDIVDYLFKAGAFKEKKVKRKTWKQKKFACKQCKPDYVCPCCEARRAFK